MQCDVTDLQGNHCPEEAVHTVVFKGVETNLCERCYANVLAGAYGSHLTQRPADEANCSFQYHLMLAAKGDTVCGVCRQPLRR